MGASDRTKELDDAFQLLAVKDKENNDMITVDGLAKIFKDLGTPYTKAEVNKMIAAVDLNGDGVIDFEEFTELLTQKHNAKMTSEEELKETFKVLDTNNDGAISPEEIRDGMKKLGISMTAAEIDEMVSHADADNDGVISWDDYKDQPRLHDMIAETMAGR